MHLGISLQKPLLMVFVVILVLSFAPKSHSYADGIKRSTIELEAIKTELLASNQEWIAFIGSDNNVRLVHPDGSSLTQITSDASSTIIYSNLKWAHDGRKLAYARVDISAGLPIAQIVILDMESLLPTTVVENSYGGFDWFEGGTKLIYDKQIDLGEYPTMDYNWEKYDGLWAFSFDTGNSDLVVAPYENNPLVNPRVSPDSSYILFDLLTLMGEGPWKNIGIYDRVDPGDYIITELSFATCDWSPDGNSIACNNCTPYFCHPEIVLLDRNGIIFNRTA
jgi:Tol biopolymer transport system component